MKIRHLLIGMLAIAGAVACKQDEPVEEPILEVNKTNVAIAATAGEGAFEVTANNAWTAAADADWVSLDPASGNGGEKAVTVKVTAEDNTAAEVRTATVTVKAGTLTKTLKVTQAAAQGENPGPGEGTLSEWALVGTFGADNNWNPASELYLSVLDEEYFVYYGLELATNSEFKFLKGGAWPPAGQEIGGNGLVEPNTIQPAGGSNIKVTEAGKYDIYLAADLATFYVMSEGKLPAEAVEPAPVEVTWGMMGCFVDNQWSTDVPMTKEGEWIVAKGAQFTELTFKIRGNASWADATNIGRAPGSERAVVNGKIEVVTAEYAKANLGGDAADIKLNGEPGTYDVYFSFENLEVYVMEAGFKPGEKEPQNPDPVEITYTVVGTLADAAWVNNAPAGLMAKEGDLYVAKNVPFVWNSTCYGGNYNIIEFKILETGTWDGFAYPEKNVDQYANAEITVQIGGENIALNAPEGNYDVYFDKANLKVWVMEAGFKPGEKEPLIPEEVEPVTEGDIWVNDGTVGAAAWSGSPYRFAKEGMDGLNECCAQIPAAVWEGMKIAPFCVNVKPATAETEWWQIRVLDGWWTNNDESGASDINPQSEGLVNNGDGTFTFQVDLTTNPDLVALIDAQHLLFAGDGFIINKIYFGDLPTPGEPELQKSNWALVGSFNGWDAAGSTAFLSVLDTDYFVYYAFEAGANTEFKFVRDGKWADQGGAEVGGAIGTAEPNTIQTAGAKNIVIAAAGKYDIYLASDLSKFYVMTEGKLPAEATEPAPVETTYTVVGTLNGINWSNNAPEGLMKKDGAYYVAKNVPFVTAKTLYGGADQFEFKIVETGTWNGYGAPAGVAAASANTEIALQEGGDNIPVKAAEGNYDVYFDKENAKVWVMEPGYKPGEKDPVQVEVTYTVTGTIKGTAADKKANYWNPSNEAGLMTVEGNYYVAKNVEFDYDYRFSDDASGEDFVKFKICETGTWNAYGQLQDGTINKPNAEIAVELDGKDIYIDRSGVYDVYFDKDNGKVWVMEAGYAPGEEIAKLDGNQWIFEGAETTVLFDFGIAEPGMLSVALPTMDGSAFGLYMIGEYLVEEFDKSSGVVLFVQYDWEFDEFGEEAEFEYSNLTASSVDIVCEAVFGTTAPVTLQKVANPYEIVVDAGGADPVGPVENGKYWFFNGEKVMAPLAEGVTTGTLPADDVISGASTEKNIFILTYDPDYSCYTIQDSYGRYLGQTDETGNITVTDVLPTDENYALYLWVVEAGYGEAHDIYNAAYYYDLTYSAADNNWVLVDGGYEYPEILPVLVKAE